MVEKQFRTKKHEVVETSHINTRMSKTLWDAINDAAKKAGLRQSAFVRAVLAVQVGQLKLRVPVAAKQLKGKGKAGMR